MFNGAEHEKAKQEISAQHTCPGHTTAQESPGRGGHIKQVNEAKKNGKGGLAPVFAPSPPEHVEVEFQGAGAQEHVGYAQYWNPYVIAEGVVVDAFGGESGEAVVELGRNGV